MATPDDRRVAELLLRRFEIEDRIADIRWGDLSTARTWPQIKPLRDQQIAITREVAALIDGGNVTAPEFIWIGQHSRRNDFRNSVARILAEPES